MKTMVIALTLVFTFAISPRALMAHPNEGHDGHGKHHDHGQECIRYEWKDAMPNLDAPPWKPFPTADDSFSFYWNTSRPEIPVAAIKIRGVHPVEGLRTRVSWQVGAEIWTARIEVEERVCVRSVIADDGSYRDLAGLYAVFMRRTKSTD